MERVAIPQLYAEDRPIGATLWAYINDEVGTRLPWQRLHAHGYVRPRSRFEMDQSLLTWLGYLGFIIWGVILFCGVHRYHKLQKRYISAIARVTGYRVHAFTRYFGEPNIYTEGSKARRLQKAYLRAYRRQVIISLGLLLGWMLLVTLAAWFLSVVSGWTHTIK